MRALGTALRLRLSRLDFVDEPLRCVDRIDVAIDDVKLSLAHRWRRDDVAAGALDRDALGHLSEAAANRLLVLPFEEHVRSAGGGAVLARRKRLVLGDERIPGGDALVLMLLRGIDIGAPHAGERTHGHGDQRLGIAAPPLLDRDRIGGRLFDAAGTGNALLELAGRVGIAARDRYLADGVAGKNRDTVLGIDQ